VTKLAVGVEDGVQALPGPEAQRRRWVELAGLLIPLAIAASLDLYRIGAQSLWLDEAFSVGMARLKWADLQTLLLSSQRNMAPYHVLLHWWVRLGTSELAVRSLSALLAAATVLPIYALGRRLFGQPTGTLAALLFAVNAFAVAQGAQEARGYALVLFLATTSSYLFVRALDRPTAANWAAYAVVGAAAMYTHFFGALVLAAHFVSGLLLPRSTGLRRYVIAATAGIGLLVSPLIPGMISGNNLWWVQRPSFGTLIDVFDDLAGRGGRGLTIAYAVACCAGLVTFRNARQPAGGRSVRWGQLFLLAWLLVPVLGSFLFSLLLKPIFISRYLIVALPAFALLAAAGVAGLRPAALRAGALVVLLGFAGRGLVHWYTGRNPKEGWRAATWELLKRARPNDAVLFEAPYVRWPFDYYVDQRGGGSVAEPLFPSMPWGAIDPFDPQFTQTLDSWLAAHRTGSRRIWVVVSHEQAGKREPQAAWYPAQLEGTVCRVEERRYVHVRVLLYDSLPCPH
jgi:mannosyltransferase